jgi:hypothetical protein
MAVETLNTSACQRVVCDAVAVDAAPLRVLLIPWGRVESSKGDFLVDQESADLVVAAFTGQSVDIPVDYEHQTLGGEYSSPSGAAPAAAWIKSLQVVPGEGIFGRVEWTVRGRELVAAKEYRYLSPVVGVRSSDRRIDELHSVGLTNKPAIVGMKPIVNKAGDTQLSELSAENRMLRASLRAFHFEDARRFWFPSPTKAPDTGVQTIAASSGRVTITSPPPVNPRQAIIEQAAARYAQESGRVEVICSAAAWVSQALRDANLRPLSDDEIRDNGLSEEAPRSKRQGAFMVAASSPRVGVAHLALSEQRPAIIRKAVGDYHADETVRKVCSARAWVNNALREAGMEPVSEDETRTHSVPVDGW